MGEISVATTFLVSAPPKGPPIHSLSQFPVQDHLVQPLNYRSTGKYHRLDYTRPLEFLLLVLDILKPDPKLFFLQPLDKLVQLMKLLD